MSRANKSTEQLLYLLDILSQTDSKSMDVNNSTSSHFLPDHGVAGSNLARGEILPEPKRRFTAQSLSCSPFHSLEMTEIC